MSCGDGPCMKCGEPTSRRCSFEKKFMCNSCFPGMTKTESMLHYIFSGNYKPVASYDSSVSLQTDRFPGESRQEYRRRVREHEKQNLK